MKILLKNGNIYDGTGLPSFVGDVLIDGERIAEIGANIDCSADKTIDCTGLCITPGFIDAHSHNDFYIHKADNNKYFESFIKQGITTQISGNCGFSPFGTDKESPHLQHIGCGLFNAANPGSFADFVQSSAGILPVNIAPLIGHGSVRAGISGFSPKPLDKAQIKQMSAHVEEAMAMGAFGGSFGLMYEPGMYAPKEELVQFAKCIAKHDGILTVHPRASSKVAVGYRPIFTKPHIELALDEVIDIANEAGAKLHYSHFICVGENTWKCSDTILKKLHKNNATYDLFSYCYGGSVITVVLPPWYLGLSEKERDGKFMRFKIRLMINIAKKAVGLDFDDITIAEISGEYSRYQGKNIAEIAKDKGLSKIDMYIKLVDASNGKARVFINKYNNEEIVLKLMRDDSSMFMTDAWIEDSGIQNSASFQGFPYFLVKAREAGLPLESVIHKMTGKTAARFGLPLRGTLKAGNFADITVFDFNGAAVDTKNPEAPPQGIKHVLINGNTAVKDGVFTPLKCGQIILKK